MTPPPSNRDRGAALEVKAWYTLREYAEATGQTVNTVERQADRGTLHTERVPGKRERVVMISYLRSEWPALWASLCTLEQMKPRPRRRS